MSNHIVSQEQICKNVVQADMALSRDKVVVLDDKAFVFDGVYLFKLVNDSNGPLLNVAKICVMPVPKTVAFDFDLIEDIDWEESELHDLPTSTVHAVVKEMADNLF